MEDWMYFFFCLDVNPKLGLNFHCSAACIAGARKSGWSFHGASAHYVATAVNDDLYFHFTLSSDPCTNKRILRLDFLDRGIQQRMGNYKRPVSRKIANKFLCANIGGNRHG